jgi:rubrerythrin
MKRRYAAGDTEGNRTGLGVSALAEEMLEVPRLTRPTSRGSGEEIADARRELAGESPSVGSMPSAMAKPRGARGSPPGDALEILLDKLGERLAFERTGSRLYDGLLSKADLESWEGGPSRVQLAKFRDEERAHVALVHDAIVALGGDPTAVTPCADIQGVASSGILQVVADARTSLSQSLDAMLSAELTDNDGWRMLIALAQPVIPEHAARFEQALEHERQHLEAVRMWLAARVEISIEIQPQPARDLPPSRSSVGRGVRSPRKRSRARPAASTPRSSKPPSRGRSRR